MENYRVDKNGTKIWYSTTCPRCGGAGGSDAWKFTGWTCYKCGGSGRVEPYIINKEYTPEYEAKLKARREARAKREAEKRVAASAEYNKAFLEKNGFNEDGITYVALGNTYGIKDTLKSEGFKFRPELGWHCAVDSGLHKVLPVSIKEFGVINQYGEYCGIKSDVIDFIKRANDELNRKNSTSEYVAEVGEKVEVEVADYKYLYTKSGPAPWIPGTSVYRLVDTDGNIFIWATNTSMVDVYHDETTHKDVERVVSSVVATVKDHKEYKGEKQTVITRGKVRYKDAVKYKGLG